VDLRDKTTNKLEEELKGLRTVTGILTGLLLVLFIACIYGLLTKNDSGTFTALIVVPIALSAILPVNYGKIKKIKMELTSRK